MFMKNNILRLLLSIVFLYEIGINLFLSVSCEKLNSRYTGWISEGLNVSINNVTALSECKMLLPPGIEIKDLIQVSYSCKNKDFITYFGANNQAIDHASMNYMDEIQTLKIGCSDGYSYVSFGGSKINQYNNTNNGFPIITTSLSAGFTSGGAARIPSLIIMEGFFSQINSFSIRRRVTTFESTNSKKWTGEYFIGGCFALLPIPQPGNIIYSIVGIGFIPRGVAPSNLNYLAKGVNIKNMVYKVGTLLSECQTLEGPELDHKDNSTIFYSIMCPNGHFHKYRTYKKYSFGTTSLASIEVSYIEIKFDYLLNLE